MALGFEAREKVMKAAALQLMPMVAMQDMLDWYAGLHKAQLGPKWIGQVILAEHARRATAKADRQRAIQKAAAKKLEREAAFKYSDQNWAARGQPQSGAKGPWSRERKALEEAAKDLDREEAEDVIFSEDEGVRDKR